MRRFFPRDRRKRQSLFFSLHFFLSFSAHDANPANTANAAHAAMPMLPMLPTPPNVMKNKADSKSRQTSSFVKGILIIHLRKRKQVRSGRERIADDVFGSHRNHPSVPIRPRCVAQLVKASFLRDHVIKVRGKGQSYKVLLWPWPFIFTLAM